MQDRQREPPAFRCSCSMWAVSANGTQRTTYEQLAVIRAYRRLFPLPELPIHGYTGTQIICYGRRRAQDFAAPEPCNWAGMRVARVEDRSHSVRSSRASRSWLSLIAIGQLAVSDSHRRAGCRVPDLAGTVRQLRDAGSRALHADQRAYGSLACRAGALARVQDVSYPSGHAW